MVSSAVRKQVGKQAMSFDIGTSLPTSVLYLYFMTATTIVRALASEPEAPSANACHCAPSQTPPAPDLVSTNPAARS